MYPAGDDKQAMASDKQVITLFTFTCPAKAYASAMSNVKSPAYFYQFTRVPPGSKLLGAFHLLDIGYVFHNFRPFLSPLKAEQYFDDTDRTLSDTMMDYWTQFAATGDPNQEGLPQWPTYDATTGEYLDFGDKIEVKSGLYNNTCDLFMNTFQERRSQ